MIKAVDSKNCKLLFDIYHQQISEGNVIRNTFLTVRPNTFTSNLFAHLCLNYTAPMPLWKTTWSQPQPFLQLGAMWGHLFGQDADGQLCQ